MVKYDILYSRIFVCFWVLTGICFITLMSSCAKKQVKKEMQLGWIDAHTLRVKATSKFDPHMTNPLKRNVFCIENALLKAMDKARYVLSGKYNAGIDYFVDKKMHEDIMEIRGAVKGGTVIDKTYTEQKNCTVIYEIRLPNLKKRSGYYTGYGIRY